ncbi:hypothetical protein ACIRU3_39805 [Streptomyces sp. NPDC101151]|uniref:hypothetical protein n=1 Tax=Streptomyces sp. NPDC101151 TaxID=3366115 RepID=UPI0038269454
MSGPEFGGRVDAGEDRRDDRLGTRVGGRARYQPRLADRDGFGLPVDVVRTAPAALVRRNPPPSVIAGRMNRLMAFLARRLATRRQVVRAIGRLLAEKA